MAPNMDDMDPFGPRDLSIFDETVPQYPPFPDCTCVIGGPESCAFHLGISDNFQPVSRIDAEFDNLLTQPDSNQELQYPSTLSHFNAPPLSQTNALMFGQQPQNATPTHNFASLHLNPEQPPDPSVNVFGTYTPGDKLLPPEAYNSGIHGFSQLYVNQLALQEQYATPDSRSDPGPSIKPLQRTRTYAQAAALPKINTQLQGQGAFGAGMMQTPQTEFRIQPPNPNVSPSEPVEILTKPSSNIRLSIRSRGATCGSSRRRDKSPSVASTGTRRSITKRNCFRKTSNAANMFLTAESADLRCKFPACRKPFDNRSALHHHEMKHTPTEEKPFQCEYPGCGMGFLWDKDLVRHMTKHTKEKPFRCGICSNKSFSRHDNLRRHYINDHPEVDPPSTSSRTGTVNSSQS